MKYAVNISAHRERRRRILTNTDKVPIDLVKPT